MRFLGKLSLTPGSNNVAGFAVPSGTALPEPHPGVLYELVQTDVNTNPPGLYLCSHNLTWERVSNIRSFSLTGDALGTASLDNYDDHVDLSVNLKQGVVLQQPVLQQLRTRQADDQTAASGTVTCDYSNGDMFKTTAQGSISIALSNLPSNYVSVMYILCVNFGSHIITWPSGTRWSTGTAPTLTATGVDMVSLVKGKDQTLYGLLMGRDLR